MINFRVDTAFASLFIYHTPVTKDKLLCNLPEKVC